MVICMDILKLLENDKSLETLRILDVYVTIEKWMKKLDSTKDEIIDFLLDALEEEHMGSRAWAIEEIKNRFNIEL